MFFECLNVYFFSETASRFRFRLHRQIKDEIFNEEKRVTNSEADGRQIESVTRCT